MCGMGDVNQLVVSNDDFESVFERMGPFIVMVDESYKRAQYPPHVWHEMDRFERQNHIGLYAVSAVQIRTDDGNEKEAWERVHKLRDRLIEAARIHFDQERPYWHTTKALADMVGPDKQMRESASQAIEGICAAINEHCDYHIAVTSCPLPSLTDTPAYVAMRQRTFRTALSELSQSSHLVVADAITTGKTMSDKRREAIMRGDAQLIYGLRRHPNHPDVLHAKTELRYASQWADPLLWAADVTAAAGRMYANRDDTLLSQLASDPRDVVTITDRAPVLHQAPTSRIEDASKVQQLRDARARLERVMRERHAAPKPQRPTPPPAPAPPPRPYRPRRPDDPSQRGPSIH